MSIYEKFEKHADKTFRQAAARYLEEFNGRRKGRIEMALSAVMPYVGDMRLIDIDDEACKPFKQDRRNGTGHFDRPAMVGTVNKELTQICTVLNRAARVWRWLPSSPMLLHVVGEHRAAYPLTWDEQSRLFCQLPTGWDVGVGVFAVNTGLRKEELFGLRWDDLVEIPELGTFVFVLNRTKNGQKRAVICNSIARRVVDIFRGKHAEMVFPTPLCRKAGKVYGEAWARAGLPTDRLTKRGIHNLRHTFAHRLRAAGVPEEDRNSLLGHNNHSLAQHYALPDIARLQAATELITERRETTVLRSTHYSDRDTAPAGRNS